MISVIIATKNRHRYLLELLNCLSLQLKLPREVLVIDASDEFKTIDPSRFPFELYHLKSKISSTALQRNMGLDKLNKESKYVAILDDDTYPEPNYISSLIIDLETCNAAGVSGVAISSEPITRTSKIEKSFKCLFQLYSFKEGIVTRSGINIPISKFKNGLKKTEWLIGCAIYDIHKLGKLRYESNLLGYALFEDVIFSLKASKKGFLFVNPQVKLRHIELSLGNTNTAEFWYKWAKNRKLVLRVLDNGMIGWVAYFWSNIGQMLFIIFSNRTSKLKLVSSIIKGSLVKV
jgi:GT2 family glycosyltransferase